MLASGRPPRVAIVAGEPSGDLIGGLMLAELAQLLPTAQVSGIAGSRMQGQGAQSLYPMERLAVRGYVEVLRHYAGIVSIRRALARHWREDPPDVFIGIDAPDFNLVLERDLKAIGVPTVHFVSPSIWAWRPERIALVREAVSHMLTLFPFEAPLYERAGVPVTFVGHPLTDLLPERPDRAAARAELRLPGGAPVVALLPGSRVSEVAHLADLMVRAAALIAARRTGVRFLVPLVNREVRSLFEAAIDRWNARGLELHLLFGHAHEAMIASDAVLLASGTATLEAALLERPMVIVYRMPWLSWRIMQRKRLLPFVGLPNILAGEFVVPELLQDEATPENTAQAMVNLLADAGVQRRVAERLRAIRATLGRGAARAAAQAIADLLRRKAGA